MAKIIDPTVEAQIHRGRREKLRESFEKFGLNTFNETQVLEFALGMTIPRVDTNPIAHRLINKFGSLNGVIDAHPSKLREVAGIGEQSAYFLSFLKQFVTYYQAHAYKNTKIKTPADAIKYLSGVMQTYSTEQFVVICLDKSGKIILENTTTSGDLNKVDLNLREIVDMCLRVRTASVLLAHNHLDANVNPSDADIRLTRHLVNIFSSLSIQVMDHLIFGIDSDAYSFARSGILDIFKREHHSYAVSMDYEDMLPLE
jgi:DNA repair protein RadC